MSVVEWICEARNLDGRLTRLAASTGGLFTFQQAGRVGLRPDFLRQRVADEVLEEFEESLTYRHLVTDAPWYDDVCRSEWTSIHPEQFVDERTDSYRQPREVVSGQWALSLQDLSPFHPHGLFLFAEPTARDFAAAAIVVHPIRSEDWTWRSGLPVARPATAIADMVLAHDDDDAIGDNLREAVRQGNFDLRRFLAIVETGSAGHPATSQSSADIFATLLGTGSSSINRDDVVTSTTFDGRSTTVTSTYPSIERP